MNAIRTSRRHTTPGRPTRRLFRSPYPNPVTITGPGLPLVLDDSNVFSGPTDNTCGVYIELFLDAALTRYADGWQIVRRGLWRAPTVGSTDYFGWFSGTTGSSSYNIVNSNRSGGTAATCRATYLALQGTGYIIEPWGVFHDMGCVPDGSRSFSATLPDNGVQWYTVCVNHDATDTNLRYLDSFTSGPADLMQAWFDSSGNPLAFGFDRDGGPGTDSQCSFGVGRRGRPAGAHADLDGRHYLSDVAPGLSATSATSRYYVAIMPNASTLGTGGFAITPSGTGGPYTFTIVTNNNAGALEPSIAPTPNDDLSHSPLTSPGRTLPPMTIGAHGVRWITFTTCRATGADDTLTITMNGSSIPNAGTSHYLFDSTGVLIASATDDGPSSVAAPLIFDASNPLPAGTYYLAQTSSSAVLLPTHDRWHLRSTSVGVASTFAGEILVTGSPCRCVADVDDGSGMGTPDGGVTIDDLLYYVALFEQGTVAADLDDGSSSGTPDGGVTIDDLLYYLARFEAGC